MKRLFAAILALCLLALPACGTVPAETTPVSTTPTPTFPICTTPVPSTPVVTTPAPTTPAPSGEQKTHDYTIYQNFSKNTIIVVMTRAASASRTYTEADFADVGCIRATELISGEKDYLILLLSKKDKQNVLDMITVLINRPDVELAYPDWAAYLDDPILVMPRYYAPDIEYPADFFALDGVDSLTAEQIEAIETAWQIENGYALKWFNQNDIVTRHFGWRYYGTVEEGILLYRPLYQLEIVDTDPGKSVMTYQRYVYKDGIFTPFEEANLSEESVTFATQIHETYEKLIAARADLDDPDAHAAPVFGSIRPCLYTDTALASWGIDPETVKYYGTYNGCVVFEELDGLSLTEHQIWIIGGKPFDRYGDRLVVYKDGEKYTLAEAFERGYLTVEDISDIAFYRYGPISTAASGYYYN
ncbi:MAG: hypothetical protein J6D21_09355 [Clostridia bacterium]|nr:hypothetical protein [Clostridia bacterium]